MYARFAGARGRYGEWTPILPMFSLPPVLWGCSRSRLYLQFGCGETGTLRPSMFFADKYNIHCQFLLIMMGGLPFSDFPCQVWVNQYNLLNNNVPFGGKKQSGIGACSFRPRDRVLPLLASSQQRDCLTLGCESREAALIVVCALPGRELGSYALEEYTSVKAVHWNYGEKLEWPL